MFEVKDFKLRGHRSRKRTSHDDKQTRANKRQIEREDRERERVNKTARVNWGERQMANNVMREIRVVMGTWYVDFCVDLPGNGARNLLATS